MVSLVSIAYIAIDERHKIWHDVVLSIGRGVRACTRLLEAAKALATRDHVRGISEPSALSNIYLSINQLS
jgi:hypothetical protein